MTWAQGDEEQSGFAPGKPVEFDDDLAVEVVDEEDRLVSELVVSPV